jgi:hypothetical protein
MNNVHEPSLWTNHEPIMNISWNFMSSYSTLEGHLVASYDMQADAKNLVVF